MRIWKPWPLAAAHCLHLHLLTVRNTYRYNVIGYTGTYHFNNSVSVWEMLAESCPSEIWYSLNKKQIASFKNINLPRGNYQLEKLSRCSMTKVWTLWLNFHFLQGVGSLITSTVSAPETKCLYHFAFLFVCFFYLMSSWQ